MTQAQKEFKNKVKGLVERQAKVGMVLVLNGKAMKCLGTEASNYGTRYVFDSGLSLTTSNITSNICKCAFEGKPWDFKF